MPYTKNDPMVNVDLGLGPDGVSRISAHGDASEFIDRPWTMMRTKTSIMVEAAALPKVLVSEHHLVDVF